MQVKKFEARTMKEALEMVKRQLGPEAIILGARDNRKSYGLVGEGSVEITAAVSDEVLAKKRLAEAKMLPELKEKFQTAPARMQKQVLEKFVASYKEEHKERKPVTSTRYIEIDDEREMGAGVLDARDAQERIKSAAQRAWSAMHGHDEGELQVAIAPKVATDSRASSAKDNEITALKNELVGLKAVLANFQKVPQTLAGSHPGASYGLPYELSATFEKLTNAGITQEIAAEILGRAQAEMPPVRFKNKALVDAWTARYILDSTQTVDPSTAHRVQLFVGPSGAGKTSALIKIAAHATVHDKKRVAILTADTFKVGATDQMRIYAQILNVPFAIVRKQSDWPYLLEQLKDFDMIMCDFPGMSLKNVDEIQKIRSLMPLNLNDVDIHLVLSALAKNEDLNEFGKRFKVTNYRDVIFNGIDQSTQHGSLYNFSRQFSVPLHSFGIGPRVPEDFEVATRERVLDLLFKLSSNKKVEAFG